MQIIAEVSGDVFQMLQDMHLLQHKDCLWKIGAINNKSEGPENILSDVNPGASARYSIDVLTNRCQIVLPFSVKSGTIKQEVV